MPRSRLQRAIAPGAPVDGWQLASSAHTKATEALAATNRPPHGLMQLAGEATARLAFALAPHADRIWVAAGPGNNGGDGLEAAARLQQAGKQVHVSLHPGDRPPDAAASLQRAVDSGVSIGVETAPPFDAASCELAIDAVFGIGLTRPPSGWALQAIRSLKTAPAPVLAIDLPSGLDADRGCLLAPNSAVHAQWTLALLTLKPGLFTGLGRDHAGEVWFDDLGVENPSAALPIDGPTLLARTSVAWPPRRHAHHKGSFGDVWVVGGADGMLGAALLASRAALAAGAGRVHCVPLASSHAECVALDGHHLELMMRRPSGPQWTAKTFERATVVCGCGGGEAVRAVLPLMLGAASRLVLDADALNSIAGDPALATQLRHRAARGQPTVLTPHPLEAARLLQSTTDTVQADRLLAARSIADQFRCTVVLKGSGSVIAQPDGPTWINASGNAALATAGTGDVLAGWLGGLWAQQLGAAEAAKLGVHSHGLAADRWRNEHPGSGALEASRLIDRLRDLRSG